MIIMTTLAVLTTDGRRGCIERTIASAETHLHGAIHSKIIFTDDDVDYEHWLNQRFPEWSVLTTGPKEGYAPAMRCAFDWLSQIVRDEEAVFWLEDDFMFNRPVDLTEMMVALDKSPRLAQMALRRQPWNQAERDAGGVVELHPDWYTDCHDPMLGFDWLEQTAFWTNNPSLFPKWVLDVPYPDSEGEFTFAIKAARPEVCFGYWGARDSGEAVLHIGDQGARH